MTQDSTEARWQALQRTHFSTERFNFNPGTLGTPVLNFQQQAWTTLQPLQGYPLGLYQAGRQALQRSRVLAQKLWPTETHDVAIGLPCTALCNLWAQAFAAQHPAPHTLRLLTTHHEHAGGLSPFLHHPRYELHYLSDEALSSPDAFAAQVSTLQPDIAFFSHSTYTMGHALPVEEWYPQIRQASPQSVVLVDVAQSLGQSALPFDAADILVGSAHKWMCGPLETGFCWLRRDRMALLPALHFTEGVLDPESPVAQYEQAGGQDFSRYLHLEALLTLWLDHGAERFYQRSAQLAQAFQDKLAPHPIVQQRMRFQHEFGGTVLTHFRQDDDPYPLYRALNDNGLHVKCIKKTLGDGQQLQLLRWGFPFYETMERLDRAIEMIVRFLKEY